MNKILTLIYPIYEYKEFEIDNILYISNNLRVSGCDILVLSDNPEINNQLSNKLSNSDNITFIPSEKNLGKYQVIKNHSNLLKSHWFKVVDPDDIILLNELENFIKEFSTFDFNEIIPFIILGPTINLNSGNYSASLVNDYDRTDFRTRTFAKNVVVNENSIIPTNSLNEFNLDIPNQTKSSDVLLSLSHFSRNDPATLQFGPTFYVYNYRNGITGLNKYNQKLFNEFLNFLNIMSNYKNVNKMSAPSRFDYLWAHNMVIESPYDIERKINIMKNVIELLKISGVDNWSKKLDCNNDEINKFFEMMEKGEKIVL